MGKTKKQNANFKICVGKKRFKKKPYNLMIKIFFNYLTFSQLSCQSDPG